MIFLTETASVVVKEQPAKLYQLNVNREIEVSVTIPAQGNTWLVLEQGK
ncbi:hypothetical protein [Niabella ginsengisoli]|uniref:Uncharacterized protein n=1 Tax=Niabella ginsengisoli TaxID=522298 RepID=A0ABS9SKD9_9BACT|nr:hypothetical protein [Niabella ginsengisoli]MCH5598854.1 hypothetical protein [Niabella ginsengisoli]